MTRTPRVYVAGAYSSNNAMGVFDNMRRGIRLAYDVLKAGFAPFVPWFDHQFGLVGPVSVDELRTYSMRWLEASDAVLVVPEGWALSIGTKDELQRAKELGIPVFWSLEELKEWRNAMNETCCVDIKVREIDANSAEAHYWKIHDEIKELHRKKGADYGTDEDPFANLRAATEFGIPAWVGVAIRMRDKMSRIQAFVKKGELQNESVEDALLDLGNYSLLALALLREARGKRLEQVEDTAAIERPTPPPNGETRDGATKPTIAS